MTTEITVPGTFGLDFAKAKDYAKSLAALVKDARLSVKIGQGEHLRIEAWQALGAMVGVVAGVDALEWIEDGEGNKIGCRAHAIPSRIDNGRWLSPGAYGRCDLSERNWKGKDLFAIESMAQTRAQSKALASVLRWIPVLVGYKGTPAEEMDESFVDEGPYPSGGSPDQPKRRGRPPKDDPERKITSTERKQLWHDWFARAKEFELSQKETEEIMRGICKDLGYADTSEIRARDLSRVRMAAKAWDPPISEGQSDEKPEDNSPQTGF